MRNGFGFNTNIFETNIINLAIVIGIVVTVVGDALRSLLSQRRETIIATWQEADQKVRAAKKRLEEAQKEVDMARSRAEEIRIQAVKTADQERSLMQDQLKEDLIRLQERSNQAIQLKRQKMVQELAQQIKDLAVTSTEKILLSTLTQGRTSTKQKELNEVHVRETFCQLRRRSQLYSSLKFFYLIFIIYFTLW